jgi:C-terminal processing protease CtpA/Prc
MLLAAAWILGAAGGRAPRAVRLVAAAPWLLLAVGVVVYDFEAARGLPELALVAGHLTLVALAAIALDGFVREAGGVWRRETLARALGVGLVPICALVAALAGAVVSLAASALTPDRPPPRLVAALDVLARLRDRYPHWDTAPLTFRELVARHRERLHGAVARCPDDRTPCPAVVDVLRDALAALDNGHVYVDWPEDWVTPPLETRLIGNHAAVSWAEDDRIAEGDVIESVDGLSVETAVARVPRWATAGYAERTRRHDAHRWLLLGREGTSVRLRLRRADGSAYEARLERPRGTEEPDEPPAADGLQDEDAPLHGWALEDGTLYMCVEGFREGARFAKALDELARKTSIDRGLVVDLRRCPGGDITLLQAFLARFVERATTIGNRCAPHPTRAVPERVHCSPLGVRAHRPRVAGGVAVLVGPDTASAAEIAAHFLCSSGRARCFGETTSGETDIAETIVLEGAAVCMSVAAFEPLEGPLLLGRGVVPHEAVPTELVHVRAGIDPALDAAVAWLASAREPAPRP